MCHLRQSTGLSTSGWGQFLPYTYLDGVLEKYVPGDYEFDVHAKLKKPP